MLRCAARLRPSARPAAHLRLFASSPPTHAGQGGRHPSQPPQTPPRAANRPRQPPPLNPAHPRPPRHGAQQYRPGESAAKDPLDIGALPARQNDVDDAIDAAAARDLCPGTNTASFDDPRSGRSNNNKLTPSGASDVPPPPSSPSVAPFPPTPGRTWKSGSFPNGIEVDQELRQSANQMLAEALAEAAEPPRPPMSFLLTPRQIRNLLDEHVIGQERLKKAISVAIYNHYKRIEINRAEADCAKDDDACSDDSQFIGKPIRSAWKPQRESGSLSVEKSNLLLLGPTGSGKTLIAKTTAKILDVPFSMNDATPFTQAGYVGEDVEVCIHKLLQNANFDVERAQRGIVFIDEIDKLARKTDASNPNQRDVSGEGVQQGLLRILEGTVVNVNVKAGSPIGNRVAAQSGEVFSVDTSNVLFICSGAFVGLEKIVQSRVGVKGSIGFDAPLNPKKEEYSENAPNMLHQSEPDDLINFGFIPEFVGRLPIVASADPLRIQDLERILTEPKNAIIRQFQEIFRCSNMQLLFHPRALRKIAETAVLKKTGARGLRRITETVLQDPLYDYPGTEYYYIVVTEEAVSGSAGVTAFTYDEQVEAYQCAGLPLPTRMYEPMHMSFSHASASEPKEAVAMTLSGDPANLSTDLKQEQSQKHIVKRISFSSIITRRKQSTPPSGPEGFDSLL